MSERTDERCISGIAGDECHGTIPSERLKYLRTHGDPLVCLPCREILDEEHDLRLSQMSAHERWKLAEKRLGGKGVVHSPQDHIH